MKSVYFLSIFFRKVTKTFAEYYKSVTNINCHVGKSFVSQLSKDNSQLSKDNMEFKKAYGK